MQKLNLSQPLSQKLSAQQSQFIKLLQVTPYRKNLILRIEEELECNRFGEGKTEDQESSDEEYEDNFWEDFLCRKVNVNLDDYLDDDYGWIQNAEMANTLLMTMTWKPISR